MINLDKTNDSRLTAILSSAGRITRKGIRAALLSGAILAPVFFGANFFAKWAYQVKTNYGIVITNWDGERIAVEKPGWYSRMPLLSTYEEEYSMANQVLFLHGETKSHEVITKESATGNGSVILAAAATFYEITDLRQYAIENITSEIETTEKRNDMQVMITKYIINPRIMLQRTLDSIVGDYIQKKDPKEIIHNRGTVENEILEALRKSDISDKFGIRINGFRFTETGYVPGVVMANAEKQASVTAAEGRYAASQIEKKTIGALAQADADKYKILEKALDPKNHDEKMAAQEIFKSLIKYKTIKERSGDSVWVLPDSSVPVPTYNPK